MQMILGEMTATRAVAPQPKVESNKFGDDDKSFQDSLDTKIQVDRDNKKASDDQEKAAVGNAANAAASATATSQTTPANQTVVDQAQVALELQAALSQDANNMVQQAVKALSQDAQQTNVQVEKLVFDLNQQDAKVDPSQTPANQVDVKVDVKVNSQTSLQSLAQQEAGSKAGAEMSLAKSEAETQPVEKTVDKVVQKPLDDEVLKAGSNTVTATQTTPNSVLEQIQSAQKKADEVSTSLILNQVMDQLKTTVQSSKDTIKIQLQPENLGKVDVRIVRGNDSVQFYFTADTLSTSRLLQSNLNQLQQSLMEAGVKVGNMSVSYQGQPGQQNNHGQSQRKNGFSIFGQDDVELAIDFQSRSAFSTLDTIA